MALDCILLYAPPFCWHQSLVCSSPILNLDFKFAHTDQHKGVYLGGKKKKRYGAAALHKITSYSLIPQLPA